MSIVQDGKRYRVTIGKNVFCSCTPSQRADKKTCSHMIWVHMNLLDFAEDDILIAQVCSPRFCFRKVSDIAMTVYLRI